MLSAIKGRVLSGIAAIKKGYLPLKVKLPDESISNSLPADIKKVLSFNKKYRQ